MSIVKQCSQYAHKLLVLVSFLIKQQGGGHTTLQVEKFGQWIKVVKGF